MAVTIETEPTSIQPASNPCVFDFSSDQTAQDSYTFQLELTINGAIHSYHDIYATSDNYGKFNCSEILRSVVFSNLIVDGTVATSYDDAICSYSIRVIDKYGTPPAQQGSWTSSTTRYAFNGSLRHIDWIDFDYLDYDTSIGNSKLALTSFPRDSYYYCGDLESMFLGILNSGNGTITITLGLYDTTGSAIGGTVVVSFVTSGRLLVADVSPQVLIANSSKTQADFDSAYYYQIAFKGTYTSEQFKIYIDRECSQYTSRRLHWLNKFGVWDSYTFNKYSEDSSTITTNGYQVEKGNWSDSNVWTYNKYNGESATYAKTAKDTLTLNSDWIKEDKHNWLVRELYESPKVYLEESQGVFELVNPQISSYTLKQKIKDGLLQEVVKLERTYFYTSQLN
jgi:hypothetical protein